MANKKKKKKAKKAAAAPVAAVPVAAVPVAAAPEPAAAHVDVDIDVSEPESLIQGIKNVRKEILNSRVGKDVRVKYLIDDRRVYLHTQRNDIYGDRFHIDDGRVWSVLKGKGGIENGFLGLGNSYKNLTGDGGVHSVVVGYPRLKRALLEILKCFTSDGEHVSEARKKNPKAWNSLLGNALASLIVMTLETARSFYVEEDMVRLIRLKTRKRKVSVAEGDAMLDWSQMSKKSLLEVGNNGYVWRNSPMEKEDVKALQEPIHAWDCTAIRCLKK